MKQTIVTGGTGLVGSAINADVHLSTEDVDLKDWKETLSMFEHLQPKNVIHCAARVGGLGGNMNYKGEFFYDNIMINTNVIESCRKYGVKKLVSFLSTCVFPANVKYPLTEKKIHLGEPHDSNYPYAYAKRMADIQLRAYREQYGLNYVSVIPTNIYGPNDNFNLKNGHVIPSLIHKCYLAKKNNEDFKVWGSGKPLREFMHVDDLADACIFLSKNYSSDEIINVGAGEEISIKDFAYKLKDIVGYKGNLKFNKSMPDGNFRKLLCTKKINSLGWKAKISLDVGLNQYYKWYKKEYKYLRK